MAVRGGQSPLVRGGVLEHEERTDGPSAKHDRRVPPPVGRVAVPAVEERRCSPFFFLPDRLAVWVAAVSGPHLRLPLATIRRDCCIASLPSTYPTPPGIDLTLQLTSHPLASKPTWGTASADPRP